MTRPSDKFLDLLVACGGMPVEPRMVAAMAKELREFRDLVAGANPLGWMASRDPMAEAEEWQHRAAKILGGK